MSDRRLSVKLVVGAHPAAITPSRPRAVARRRPPCPRRRAVAARLRRIASEIGRLADEAPGDGGALIFAANAVEAAADDIEAA
jgi:hypothetical protein